MDLYGGVFDSLHTWIVCYSPTVITVDRCPSGISVKWRELTRLICKYLLDWIYGEFNFRKQERSHPDLHHEVLASRTTLISSKWKQGHLQFYRTFAKPSVITAYLFYFFFLLFVFPDSLKKKTWICTQYFKRHTCSTQECYVCDCFSSLRQVSLRASFSLNSISSRRLVSRVLDLIYVNSTVSWYVWTWLLQPRC